MKKVHKFAVFSFRIDTFIHDLQQRLIIVRNFSQRLHTRGSRVKAMSRFLSALKVFSGIQLCEGFVNLKIARSYDLPRSRKAS